MGGFGGVGFAILLFQLAVSALPSKKTWNRVQPHAAGLRRYPRPLLSKASDAQFSQTREFLDRKRIDAIRGGCNSENGEIVSNPKTLDDLLFTSRADIAKAFSKFDNDNSGVINKEELHHALLELGMNATGSELDAIFEGLDEDGDETINFEVSQVLNTSNNYQQRRLFISFVGI
jgi:hypothetical protein